MWTYCTRSGHRHAKWTHRSRLPARGSHRLRKVDTPPLHSHRPPGDGHTVSAKVASKRSSHPLRSGHTTPVQREGVQRPPTLGGHPDPSSSLVLHSLFYFSSSLLFSTFSLLHPGNFGRGFSSFDSTPHFSDPALSLTEGGAAIAH